MPDLCPGFTILVAEASERSHHSHPQPQITKRCRIKATI